MISAPSGTIALMPSVKLTSTVKSFTYRTFFARGNMITPTLMVEPFAVRAPLVVHSNSTSARHDADWPIRLPMPVLAEAIYLDTHRSGQSESAPHARHTRHENAAEDDPDR